MKKTIIAIILTFTAAAIFACGGAGTATNSNQTLNKPANSNGAIKYTGNAELDAEMEKIRQDSEELKKKLEETQKKVDQAQPELENLNKQLEKTSKGIEEVNRRIKKLK
jgi:peptidoglycan hydrolase CwlO-like protein